MDVERDNSMLYRTVIESGIVLAQVWNIYNESVPLTGEQYINSENNKNYDRYENEETRENYYFNLDYNENEPKAKYGKEKESEDKARMRYDEFKEYARKDLKAVLKMLNSPLIYYANSKENKKIPVIVAAVFAAIYDLRKYGALSPKKMIELSKEVNDDEIRMFLFHVKGEDFDEDDYFIMRLIENLKYFFNIKPELEETNLGIVRKFDYELIEEGCHYLIQQKTKIEEAEEVNIREMIILPDKDDITAEIEEFKRVYLENVNHRRDESQKAWKILEMAEELLKKYPYQDDFDRIEKLKQMEPSLEPRDHAKIRMAVLLDFTEKPFCVVHDILGKRNSDGFYKKNVELKKNVSESGEVVAAAIKELENVRHMIDSEFKRIIDDSRRMS